MVAATPLHDIVPQAESAATATPSSASSASSTAYSALASTSEFNIRFIICDSVTT